MRVSPMNPSAVADRDFGTQPSVTQQTSQAESQQPSTSSTSGKQNGVKDTRLAQLVGIPGSVKLLPHTNSGSAVQPIAAQAQPASPAQTSPSGTPTPAAKSSEAVLAPLEQRASKTPQIGPGSQGRLYASPEMKAATRTLLQELSNYSNSQERLEVLREVANRNFGFYTGLLASVGETGSATDREMVTDALGEGLKKGTLPAIGLPLPDGKKLPMDPVGWLMHTGPYTGPTQRGQDYFRQVEQFKALGNIVNLVNSRPDVAFQYRGMLAKEAVEAGALRYQATGEELASIAASWAQGKSGQEFSRDVAMTLKNGGYARLFDSVAKDFYRPGGTTASGEARDLLIRAAEAPGMHEKISLELSKWDRNTGIQTSKTATAYTRAVAAYADPIFDQLTNPREHVKNGADSSLRAVLNLTYHNMDVANSARDLMKTEMGRFVFDMKRDALRFALDTGSGAELSSSAAMQRLELLTAAFVNSYKDRHDELHNNFEAKKQFYSKTFFWPLDFVPVGSAIASLGSEADGYNLWTKWARQTGSPFVKSDLVKNWANSGNSGSLTRYMTDWVGGKFAGTQPPTFESKEVKDQAADAMLNLDVDIAILRRDRAAFNQIYGLPTTNPHTGERYEAATEAEAQRLLTWVDRAGARAGDPAFSEPYTKLKALLAF